METTEKKRGLSSFVLKIIACVLMTLDHIALLFIARGSGDIPTAYYVLRAIGKMAFPIFAFLAVEGVYHTKDIRKYLLRLFLFAFGLDAFGYAVSFITKIPIGDNPLIGNAFTDIFLGVLTVYLLRKKNLFSLLAVFPIAYAFFCDYPIDVSYGTLFKADWGFYSIVLFVLYFLAKEGARAYLRSKAKKDGVEIESYQDVYGLRYEKIFESFALLLCGLVFSLIWKIDYTSYLLPNEFIPIGSYSILAIVFLLLYSGERGYSKPWVKWLFYGYYPFHLVLLGILSLFFGTLSTLLA
jgi:hypothetical protein